jgi:hypothetical protein
MATTVKKTKKKTKKKTTPKKGYKVLWIGDEDLFVLITEKIAKGTIVRFTKVSFGTENEDGTIPVSFIADVLDNPKKIDFESDTQYEKNNSYLGNVIATVVMDSINDEDGMIQITGTDDGENRTTDSK